MVKKEKSYGLNRLKSKEARATIVQKLAVDFNLTPIKDTILYKLKEDPRQISMAEKLELLP